MVALCNMTVVIMYTLLWVESIDKFSDHLLKALNPNPNDLMGHFRKHSHSPPPPPEAVQWGRREQFVSDTAKCIRTFEGGRGGGVNFQFPPWGRYGCFLE